MRGLIRIALITGMITMGCCLPALAAVEVNRLATLEFERPPLDIAFSQGDGRIFVLLEGGELRILAASGELQQRLSLDLQASSLALTPDGRRLFLLDQHGKQLQIVELDLVFELPINRSAVKGLASAPVTLTVFSDFQCPYCARLVPVLDQILADYPQQVKLVFKQFPLPMHPFAEAAATASLAARDQGRFWPLHDRLFANFNQLNTAKIRDLAAAAGLDMARFDRDLGAAAYRQEVQADMQLGQQVGVRGTPAVFVNGKPLAERSPDGFRAMIERELARQQH